MFFLSTYQNCNLGLYKVYSLFQVIQNCLILLSKSEECVCAQCVYVELGGGVVFISSF